MPFMFFLMRHGIYNFTKIEQKKKMQHLWLISKIKGLSQTYICNDQYILL